jgi:hypothetical protein
MEHVEMVRDLDGFWDDTGGMRTATPVCDAKRQRDWAGLDGLEKENEVAVITLRSP